MNIMFYVGILIILTIIFAFASKSFDSIGDLVFKVIDLFKNEDEKDDEQDE